MSIVCVCVSIILDEYFVSDQYSIIIIIEKKFKRNLIHSDGCCYGGGGGGVRCVKSGD